MVASEALITQGADVITHHTDSTAPVLTAEEKGVYAIAYHSDMSKYGPNAHLTAATHVYGDFYTKTTQAVLDKTWKPEVVWYGIKEGSIELAPINPAVPADVVALVEKTTKGIADGSFHPFQGPVKDQSGKVVVEAGKSLTDKDLLLLKSPAQFFIAETWMLDLLYKNGHRFGIRRQPGGPAHQPSLLSLLLVTDWG